MAKDLQLNEQDFKFLGIGAGAAVAVWLIPYLVLFSHAVTFYALLLAGTSSIYYGSFLMQPWNQQVFIEEMAVNSTIFLCSLFGLMFSSKWTALGFIGHGAWDVFHHINERGVKGVARWFPMVCISFDAVIAILIFLYNSGQ